MPLAQGNLGTCPLPEIIANTAMTADEGRRLLAALLFLRWADFEETEREAIALFEDTPYAPVLPEALHWRRWHRLPGEEINDFLLNRLAPTLERLDGHAPHSALVHLGLFADDVKRAVELPPEEVLALVRWCAALPFETHRDRQRALAAFDDACGKNRGKSAEQYRTAPEIARLMAAIARPDPGETIYDPCFGVGNTLLAAHQFARQQRNRRAHGELSGADQGPGFSWGLDIVGMELNSGIFRVGLVRLLLAGIESPRVLPGNALERSQLTDDLPRGMDLVLADPPLGARVPLANTLQYPVPTTDTTALLLQHALASLRPRGRVVMLIANGLLFNKNQAGLRRWLLQRHQLRAIVALPQGALPGTGIQTSILLIGAEGPTQRVRMIDASRHFERAAGSRAPTMTPDAVDAIAQMVHAPATEGTAWEVSIGEIEAADWDLTPRQRQLSELERRLPELARRFPELGDAGETAALGDIAEVRLGTALNRDLRLDDPHRAERPVPLLTLKSLGKAEQKPTAWVDAARLTGAGTRHRLRAGELLLSRSGTIGLADMVRDQAVGGIAGPSLYVLRADPNRVDAHYLRAFLDSRPARAWMQDAAQGATVRTLSIANLARLPVPLPPLPMQARVAERWRSAGEDAFECLTRLLSAAEADPIAESIARWVEATAIGLTSGVPEDGEAVIAQLDDQSRHLAPVRRCVGCGHPHWTDDHAGRSSHCGWPDFYDRAPEGMCLACWLDVSQETEVVDLEGGGTLVDWCIALNEALLSLRGLSEIPPSSRLHLLKDAAHGLERAAGKVAGHLPDEERARSITFALTERVQRAMTDLLDAVALSFTPGATSVGSSDQFEAPIRISNRGTLPLRQLHIDSSPFHGGGTIGFLGENQDATIVLKGTVVPGMAQHAIRLSWTGKDLAGQMRRGETEVVVALPSDQQSREHNADLGASPYITANPVDPSRDDVFFGREQELDQIRRQVMTSANVVLLEGNRRAGKSSILKHLEGPDPIPGWLGVYSSLQGAEGSDAATGVPTADVFRQLAADIAKAIHRLAVDTPLPNGQMLAADKKPIGIARACRAGISPDGAFADFREHLELLLELAASKGLGILLLLDEFDKLQEGIDNGITSPQVPENIRFLVQNLPGFSAVLTGSRRLKRLREEYWSALFGLGTRIGISALPRQAAERLITQPVAGRLDFTVSAVERVIELTARQPFLMQNLCNRIFVLVVRTESNTAERPALGDAISIGAAVAAGVAAPVAVGALAGLKLAEYLSKRRGADYRVVTAQLVDQAAQELIEDNEHFAALWGYAKNDRRRCILALCHRQAETGTALRFGELSSRLEQLGIEVADETLELDLEHLRELELLRLDGSGDSARYRLCVPLMGLWIERQQDFDGLVAKARIETVDDDD